MKQLVFMLAAMALGCIGSFTAGPFLGLAVYYLFAALRPQNIWEWSLPRDVSWSLYVALATIGATLLGFQRKNDENERIKMNAVHRFFLLFGVWICLSYIFAIHPESGNDWMIAYVKHYVMFVIAFLVVRTVRQVWILFNIIAISLGYISYEINYLYLVNGYLGIQKNGFGGNDNNGAGLLLAMAVPMCIALWEGTRRNYRWLYLALVPLIIHAVLMTYSRGAMLSMLIAAPMMLLRGGNRTRKLVVASVLALIIPVLAGQEIRNRFFTISEHDSDDSAQSRYTSWVIAWRIACEHPLLGVGVRNSSLLTYAYGADKEGRVIHDQYLQIAADNGFVGMGLYALVLISTFRSLFTVRSLLIGRQDNEATQARAVAYGLEGAFVTFCVGAIFLSVEAFELQYLLFAIASQLFAICRAKSESIVKEVPATIATSMS